VKRWQKLVVVVILIAGAVLLVGISATIGWRPFIGPRARPLTDRRIEATPARVARGEYLVRSVAVCLYCHSELDTATDGLPIKAGMEGSGRRFFEDGLTWLVVPNITPDQQTGAGAWSDDAIARAVREGVGHDGRALFPVMPYGNYRVMADEDLASVVAYVRSLRPINRAQPRSDIPFPVNRLINTEPQPIEGPVAPPDTSTPAARGKYLTRLASCTECHTPRDPRGQLLPGMEFAGGNMVMHPERTPVASANLTPATNGIPYYTEDLFVETIRTGRVRERKLSDLMPWGHYRGMTDDDLKAIFAYLKTLTPVEHYVDNTARVTACARCRLEHGGGERNKKEEGRR
jgi:mono/diheme cytochrome c family protein